MKNTAYDLPSEIGEKVSAITASMTEESLIDKIWAKNAAVWTDSGEDKWLGWLDIIERVSGDPARYKEIKTDIDAAGFDDIVLMGMGGSSLGPEVMARTFGNTRFHILDSTVPAQVLTLQSRIDPAQTLFIVASKSGTTLEPNCFFAYFYDVVVKAVGADNAGRHFIAITDPGSKMEAAARDNNFRTIVFGEPTVGGRFSVLSPFGATAAALIGYDLERFMAKAREMSDHCREPNPADNPGAKLGIFMGACHAAGRDKLTIFTSGRSATIGAWMEQLIAESTGKNGVAIIPVNGEALSPELFDRYRNDRAFVFISMGEGADLESAQRELSKRGHPTVSIGLDDEYDLASEFFRWEFATAVAGSLMRINPFDQPDVESAKIEARKITDLYEETGSLPDETPFFVSDDVELYGGDTYAADLMRADGESSAAEIIRRHLDNAAAGDYYGLLAYIEMNDEHQATLADFRRRLVERDGRATSLGFGPRFLHSTGQAYKGGADNGVFLQITSDDALDAAVPGQKYTFGVVKAAQARGDFHVLVDRGRRALRVHIKGDVADGLARLLASVNL
jgi:transaldolase / glucose-6-phosphate isomerase